MHKKIKTAVVFVAAVLALSPLAQAQSGLTPPVLRSQQFNFQEIPQNRTQGQDMSHNEPLRLSRQARGYEGLWCGQLSCTAGPEKTVSFRIFGGGGGPALEQDFLASFNLGAPHRCDVHGRKLDSEGYEYEVTSDLIYRDYIYQTWDGLVSSSTPYLTSFITNISYILQGDGSIAIREEEKIIRISDAMGQAVEHQTDARSCGGTVRRMSQEEYENNGCVVNEDLVGRAVVK